MKSRLKADPNAPKPVHPRAVRLHGLFGLTNVSQHMMADDRWTQNSLMEEFKCMADLLGRRLVFKKLEAKATQKEYRLENRKLRRHVREGRSKLQMVLYGKNTKAIRNFLIDHKDMQRLYQHMPVSTVVDNINQRTFVMRKERDRLRFRLDQLQKEYGVRLLQRAEVENRFKYENEFILEEDIKSHDYMKRIENSNVRLNANKTINNTYKKMVQVLQQDSIFYEPILRSLTDDIEDQAHFINHVLYLGMPAISKFKELAEEYKALEKKSRQLMQQKLQWVSDFKKTMDERKSVFAAKITAKADTVDAAKRYVRETGSMLQLRNELETIEDVMKGVKYITLCSQAREIYPRIKSQLDSNKKLDKVIQKGSLDYEHIINNMKGAQILEGVLVHNLSEEETLRLEQIASLREKIANEDQIEADLLSYIKNRANTFVLLRFTIWSLCDIVRHVHPPLRLKRMGYPNSYLKLPLLKFDMLSMKAFAPEIFSEDVKELLQALIIKVRKLMKNYKDFPEEKMEAHLQSYQKGFLNLDYEVMSSDNAIKEDEIEAYSEVKTTQNVPNRKQIKALSAKLVEELSKKED